MVRNTSWWRPIKDFVFSGAAMDVSSVSMKTFGVIWLLVICSFFAKLTGAMVPSLLCKIPLVDALSLGLVVGAQGNTGILVWQHGMMLRVMINSLINFSLISLLPVFTACDNILECPLSNESMVEIVLKFLENI